MFLSLFFLHLNSIKALVVALTGLAPSASLGSQCPSYSASLLYLVFFHTIFQYIFQSVSQAFSLSNPF